MQLGVEQIIDVTPLPMNDSTRDNQPASSNTSPPNEISKKELLVATGISYGQLYRWKREGLIPEEWFQKRSAFTGQETFFPRELVLDRISAIQSMKDVASLAEIRQSLEAQDRVVNVEHLLLSNNIYAKDFVEKLAAECRQADIDEKSVAAVSALAAAFKDAGVKEQEQRNILEIVVGALTSGGSSQVNTEQPKDKEDTENTSGKQTEPTKHIKQSKETTKERTQLKTQKEN